MQCTDAGGFTEDAAIRWALNMVPRLVGNVANSTLSRIMASRPVLVSPPLKFV